MTTHELSAPTCPPPSPARPSGCRGGCTAGASWPGSRSWSSATAAGSPRSWCAATAPARAARGDPGRGGRDGDRQPAGARRDRGDRADDPGAVRRRRHAAGRAVAADPERRPADHARPRRRHLAAPAPAGQVGAGGRQPARLPRHPRRGRLHRDLPPPSWSSRPPRAAPTCSRSTTSAGRRTSRRARSSTSRCWSGCSSASTRSAPVFRAEPHDTVRHLAEYVSLDVELGFIEDHREVIACLRDVVAGMVAAVHEHAAPAVERLGIDVPVVPEEIPLLHFRDALRIAGAPDRRARPRPGARARARRVGEGRARQRLRGRRGLPDGQPGVLQPPRPRGPALVAGRST